MSWYVSGLATFRIRAPRPDRRFRRTDNTPMFLLPFQDIGTDLRAFWYIAPSSNIQHRTSTSCFGALSQLLFLRAFCAVANCAFAFVFPVSGLPKLCSEEYCHHAYSPIIYITCLVRLFVSSSKLSKAIDARTTLVEGWHCVSSRKSWVSTSEDGAWTKWSFLVAGILQRRQWRWLGRHPWHHLKA